MKQFSCKSKFSSIMDLLVGLRICPSFTFVTVYILVDTPQATFVDNFMRYTQLTLKSRSSWIIANAGGVALNCLLNTH